LPHEGLLPQIKRLLVGEPIPSHLAHHERLSRVTGLAVLSSDALSSVLIVGGRAAFGYAMPISLLIAALLLIVAFSYRQTIFAYPNGGGAYIVAKENISQTAGLVAASALLIDYTLTVAVSIAAGVAAVTSALPQYHVNRVELGLIFLTLLTLGNLRGIRESGRIFAVPTYFFIASILVLLGVGGWRYFTGGVAPLVEDPLLAANQLPNLTLLVMLTAFSNGCTAMTGVEAVSNGVPAFRPPEAKNAASTLVTMALLAVTMFVGITLLAHAYHVMPNEHETVVSQLARGVFGGRGIPYYLVQVATMLILVLAANTAFADFPRLSSIVARDGFLPRQFMNQGDRLAFSNGIIVLSVFAGILLILFHGDTQSLLPLYMIGVFVSFTLSQSGMVIHWRRLRDAGWRSSAVVNGVGAVVTAVVLVIVAITKALEGAWIIILLIPCLVAMFRATRRHYDRVAAQLSTRGMSAPIRRHNIVMVPISGIQRAVLEALQYARSMSDDVQAVYVNVDPATTETVQRDWSKWGEGIRLVVLDSPFRSLMEPLLEHIEQTQTANPEDYVTVILPEFLPAKWWHHLLHNQRALLIKGALLFRARVVVTSVPFHLAR
jgi:amino acid transporter